MSSKKPVLKSFKWPSGLQSHYHCKTGQLCAGRRAGSQGCARQAGAMASLPSDALPQHLSKQSRTGPVTVTRVSRQPKKSAVTRQVHDQCRNSSQQGKVRISEHRHAYNTASMQLRIQKGEATNNASPRSCRRFHQVRADLHRGS